MAKEMAVDYSSANEKRTKLFFDAVNAQVEAETNAIIRDSEEEKKKIVKKANDTFTKRASVLSIHLTLPATGHHLYPSAAVHNSFSLFSVCLKVSIIEQSRYSNLSVTSIFIPNLITTSFFQ